MHAGETIVCAFALLLQSQHREKRTPKRQINFPVKTLSNKYMGMRNPCHIASAEGGGLFLPFVFGIL
jgi:hypothetical protein